MLYIFINNILLCKNYNKKFVLLMFLWVNIDINNNILLYWHQIQNTDQTLNLKFYI